MNPPPGPPAIAVVVCTHNRARLLGRALESLAAQTLPAGHRELILVDDGSTDDTPAVVGAFAARTPGFLAIRQPNAGLGAARNTGWRAARSPLIAFLDDDAVAPPEWLETICAAFAVAGSRVAVLGGPIELEWESPPPAWLTHDLKRWLGAFDLGRDPLTSLDGPTFCGGNMAFRAEALRVVGGFQVNLGRKGASLLSHEESAIWAAVAALGWTNAYVPTLRVRHFAPANRMTIPWFRRRLFWEGVSMARRETWPEDLGRARRLRRWVGTATTRLASAAFLRPLLRPWRLGRDVRWQTYCAYHTGYLREMLPRMFPARKTGDS